MITIPTRYCETKSVQALLQNTYSKSEKTFIATLQQRRYKTHNRIELICPQYIKKDYPKSTKPESKIIETVAECNCPKYFGNIESWSTQKIARVIKQLKTLSQFPEYSKAQEYNKFIDKYSARYDYSDLSRTNLPIS